MPGASHRGRPRSVRECSSATGRVAARRTSTLPRLGPAAVQKQARQRDACNQRQLRAAMPGQIQRSVGLESPCWLASPPPPAAPTRRRYHATVSSDLSPDTSSAAAALSTGTRSQSGSFVSTCASVSETSLPVKKLLAREHPRTAPRRSRPRYPRVCPPPCPRACCSGLIYASRSQGSRPRSRSAKW